MTYTRQEVKQMSKGEMILAIKEIKGTEAAIKINRKVEEKYNTERDKTNWIRFALNTIIRNNKTIIKKKARAAQPPGKDEKRMNIQSSIFDDGTLENVEVNEELKISFRELLNNLESMELEEKVATLNEFKIMMHEVSPFNSEPVDLVLWVKNERVGANDYNPNSVAPPEMELLEHSISTDGYTQPIVSWEKEDEDNYE